MTMPQVQPAACRECGLPSHAGSLLCERHLRGLAFATLDRKRWPRLKVAGGVISGDDQWRPWLREASGEQYFVVLKALGVDPAKVSWQ